METPAMMPLRPFLVRAMLDWIHANDMKPYVLVDATVPGTQIPRQFVSDGKIVLNLANTAIESLMIGDYQLSFHARFSGQPQQVILPMESLLSIYAHETGTGMNFPPELAPSSPPTPTPTGPTIKERRAHLRVVK